jgi:hypothetical protein
MATLFRRTIRKPPAEAYYILLGDVPLTLRNQHPKTNQMPSKKAWVWKMPEIPWEEDYEV